MSKNFLLISISLFIFQCFSFGQGSAYTGTYISSSPIVYSGISNKAINGLAITNSSGHCISLTNCSNITISNCKLGASRNEGVFLYNCTNITVTNCTMESVETGVYAELCSGIKVVYNDVKNVQGPFPRGQMAQFNNVSGGGNSISYNVSENIQGQSYPEDCINLYKSSGLVGDPIQVVGNWIRGGGPSASGGGIMAGDNGGSHVIVKDNILVDPGQYGISVSSGTDISVTNNKIFGKQQSFTNVGIFCWNQTSTPCSSITVMNNQVNFTSSKGLLNTLWDGGNCGVITGWNTNVYNSSLNASILPSVIIGRAKGGTTDVNTTPVINYKIFPNPVFSSSIVVTMDTPNNETVSISNSKGQNVIEVSISSTRTEIDTSILTAGIYTVKISNSQGVVEARKVLISKG
jgi:parallel beta-helix repeat protein